MSFKTVNNITHSLVLYAIIIFIAFFTLMFLIAAISISDNPEQISEVGKHRVFITKMISLSILVILCLLSYVVTNFNTLYLKYKVYGKGFKKMNHIYLYGHIEIREKLHGHRFIFFYDLSNNDNEKEISITEGKFISTTSFFNDSCFISNSNVSPYCGKQWTNRIPLNRVMYWKPLTRSWEELEKELNIPLSVLN